MAKATKEEMLKLANAFEEQADMLPEESIFGDVNDLEGMRKSAVKCREVAEKLDDKEWLEYERALLVKVLDEFADDDILYDRYGTQLGVIDFALGLDAMIYDDMVVDMGG
ncbi:MAG: hypothetical protein ACTSPB_00180 [Candidatus Thorarchaeota archaeon]